MHPSAPTWLEVSHGLSTSTITEYPQSFNCLPLSKSDSPTITLLVGRNMKSRVLRHWLHGLDGGILADSHEGQMLLWSAPSTCYAKTIFADFEFSRASTARAASRCGPGPERSHQLQWTSSTQGADERRRIENLLCDRVVGPLCDSICYFAPDLGGLRSVAMLLAEQLAMPPSCDLPSRSRPNVLVVVETTCKSFDPHAAEGKVLEAMTDILKQEHGSESSIQDVISAHFDRINVLGVRKSLSNRDRSRSIRRRLARMKDEALKSKAMCGTAFSTTHLHAFASRLLDHFSSSQDSPFSFARSSRSAGFQDQDFFLHLKELLSLLPSESWLFHLVCPLLSSAIIFALYPTGSHKFPVGWLFERIFENRIKRLLRENFTQDSVRHGFLQSLKRSLTDDYREITLGFRAQDLHIRTLTNLHRFLAMIKTHKTCLCCLLQTPEKVLRCQHAICDTCIRNLALRSPEDRHGFVLTNCPLCGMYHGDNTFRLIPPTAGIRVLALDGGGIKGIIPLVFLRSLESCLSYLGAPLRNHFDYVCGTSAGGLVIIGIFLMRWSVDECIQRFFALAHQTFASSHRRGSVFARLQELALSYLRDWQYSSCAIENAFRSEMGADLQMFNPLSDDTRVAVTTTSAKEPQPCIFTNYNAGVRPQTLGYNLIRADKSEHDVRVAEAAACTSAAPWFFKPILLRNLGTFQDGGLQHNNPLNLALWEVKYTWPTRSLPDFAVSIGTGTSDSVFKIGPQSPVRKRFLARIFETFMDSMDGEKSWKEFYNGIPTKDKGRFHRMNLTLTGPQPSLDDVTMMKSLENQAVDHMRCSLETRTIIDSMIASSFYFELDEVPSWDVTSYQCTGHIFCRLPLDMAGRKALLEQLMSTSSYFLILGQPVACVESLVRSPPPYRRQIRFPVRDLDEKVGITLRGITSEPRTISGLPKSVREIMEAQVMEAPFGRADGTADEKPLPNAPRKRKVEDAGWI